MISSFRWWSKVKFTIVFFVEERYCLYWRNILESRMLNLSLLNLKLLLILSLLLLHLEIVIEKILFWNLHVSLDVLNVCIMSFEIFLSAFKNYTEVVIKLLSIFSFTEFDLWNSSSDDWTNINNTRQVSSILIKEISIIFSNICIKTILKSTQDPSRLVSLWIINFENCCRYNNSFFKRSFTFINKTIEKLFICKLLILIGKSPQYVCLFPWISKWIH